MARLAQVPIDQKAVRRAPYEKLVEFLLGLLTGIEYLTDLSEGAAPLVKDAEVAAAWQLHPLADASGVSRTLAACDEQTVMCSKASWMPSASRFWTVPWATCGSANAAGVGCGFDRRPVSSTSQTFPARLRLHGRRSPPGLSVG